MFIRLYKKIGILEFKKKLISMYSNTINSCLVIFPVIIVVNVKPTIFQAIYRFSK